MIYLQLLLFSAGKVSFLCHFDCFSVYLQWVRKRPTPSTLGSLCRWSVEESWCMRCCRQLLSSQALRGPCTPIAHSKKNIICAGEDQACNKQIWFFFPSYFMTFYKIKSSALRKLHWQTLLCCEQDLAVLIQGEVSYSGPSSHY